MLGFSTHVNWYAGNSNETVAERHKCKHTQNRYEWHICCWIFHFNVVFAELASIRLVSAPHCAASCVGFYCWIDIACVTIFQCVFSTKSTKHGPIVWAFVAQYSQLCINRCVGNTKNRLSERIRIFVHRLIYVLPMAANFLVFYLSLEIGPLSTSVKRTPSTGPTAMIMRQSNNWKNIYKRNKEKEVTNET